MATSGRRAIVNAGAVALGGAGVGLLPTRAAVANADPTLTAVSTLNVGDDFSTLTSGVKVKEVRPGTGPAVQMGDTVALQYSGRCLNREPSLSQTHAVDALPTCGAESPQRVAE